MADIEYLIIRSYGSGIGMHHLCPAGGDLFYFLYLHYYSVPAILLYQYCKQYQGEQEVYCFGFYHITYQRRAIFWHGFVPADDDARRTIQGPVLSQYRR